MEAIARARQDFKTTKNSVIGHYLIHSYLYYIRNISCIEDSDYDNMAKYILNNYDVLEHKLKHLITQDDLRAGTLYHLKESDYPEGLRRIADRIHRESKIHEAIKWLTLNTI